MEVHLQLEQLDPRYSVLQADHAILHLPGGVQEVYLSERW